MTKYCSNAPKLVLLKECYQKVSGPGQWIICKWSKYMPKMALLPKAQYRFMNIRKKAANSDITNSRIKQK